MQVSMPLFYAESVRSIDRENQIGSNLFKMTIQNQDDWVQFRFCDRNLVNQRNDASKWNANKNIIIYISYIIQKRVLWAEFQNSSSFIFSIRIASIGANEIRKNHFS